MIHAYILDIAKDEKIQRVSADEPAEMLTWLQYQIPSLEVTEPEVAKGFMRDVDGVYTVKVWTEDAHSITVDVTAESVEDDTDEPEKPSRRRRTVQP